jgi:hypothetical protein
VIGWIVSAVRNAFLGGMIVLVCVLCMFWDAVLGRRRKAK